MKKVLIALCATALLLGPGVGYAAKKAPSKSIQKKSVKPYVNKEYGIQINFSPAWKGYSVEVDSDGRIYISILGVGEAKGSSIEAFSLYAIKNVKGKALSDLIKGKGPVGEVIGSNKKYHITYQRTQDAAGLPKEVIDDMMNGGIKKSIKIIGLIPPQIRRK